MTSPQELPTSLMLIAELPGAYGEHLALHPDGHRWALADSRSIQLGTDAELGPKLTAARPILDLAWAPDGAALYAAPQVYDVAAATFLPLPSLTAALASGLEPPPPPEQLGLVAARFAPDGRELLASARVQPSRALGAEDYRGPRERLLVLRADGTARGVLASGDDELRALAVSPHRLAAGGASIDLWDRASLRKLATLAHHKLVTRALAFNAAGDRLAALAADGEVSLWDVSTDGKLLTSFSAHQGDGYAIAIHPGLPLLATGGQDNHLRLWTFDGKLVTEAAMPGWVQAVAFDATGTRVAAVVRSRPSKLAIFALR